MRPFMLALCASACVATAKLPPPRALPPDVSFAGDWESSFGPLHLDQQRDWAFGTYGQKGAIFGNVQGNQLRFNWRDHATGSWGKGYFLLAREGTQMDGEYGSEEDEVGASACWARRKASRSRE